MPAGLRCRMRGAPLRGGWPVNQRGWSTGNARARADPAIGWAWVSAFGCQLGSANSWVEGAVCAAGRSLPAMKSGLRAHGSNQRFHRLLGHAVARALTTAPRLTGLGPAAPEILILQGWRRKRRPGRCRINPSAVRFVVATSQSADRRGRAWSRNVQIGHVSRPGLVESCSARLSRGGRLCAPHNSPDLCDSVPGGACAATHDG